MGWTLKDIERLKAEGKIRDFKIIGLKEKPSKRAKYNNDKILWDGELFDSKKELTVYKELLLRLKIGEIGQLRRQVKYELIGKQKGERKCEYWADFEYIESKTGELVVVDVKSEVTRKLSTYVMKRKLMLKVHGIKIKEV